MKKTLIVVAVLLLPNISYSSSMKSIGKEGNERKVSRVIVVKMHDNYYEPNKIKIKKGETVKFIVKNLGELVHEYNIATNEMHLKHQPEMQKMVDQEIILADKINKTKMKKMSKIDNTMSHSHSNSLLLEPKKEGVIIWTFETEADLEVACNVPGHYEAGMIAKIIK
jgi:uncharacterized cupredoxin-like copper-binding protein